MEKLLRTGEVAALLGCRESAIRKWRYLGLLPAVRVGKRAIRYRVRDLQRIVKELPAWADRRGGQR